MSRKKKHKLFYEVRSDAERMAPSWLSVRIDGENVKLLYHIIDGAVQMKGVKVNHEVAEIGAVIIFDGKRLSVKKNLCHRLDRKEKK